MVGLWQVSHMTMVIWEAPRLPAVRFSPSSRLDSHDTSAESPAFCGFNSHQAAVILLLDSLVVDVFPPWPQFALAAPLASVHFHPRGGQFFHRMTWVYLKMVPPSGQQGKLPWSNGFSFFPLNFLTTKTWPFQRPSTRLDGHELGDGLHMRIPWGLSYSMIWTYVI